MIRAPDFASDLFDVLRRALALHQSDRLKEAEVLYRRVLQAEPAQPDATHFLGLLAHQCGREEAAVELIKTSLRLKPANALYHNNLAGVYKELGWFNQAVASYREAIRIAPDYADAQNNLGMALVLQNQLESAVSCFDRALDLNPQFYRACANLGDALRELGRAGQALATYRRALSIEPDNAENQLYMGLAFRQLGQEEQALNCLHQALALKPNYVDAHRALGMALADAGEFDSAAACYRRVLELSSTHVGAYFNLAGIDRLHPEDAEHAELKRLSTRVGSLGRDDAFKLHFTLGELEDEAGNYEAAFQHWSAGNRLKRQTINYDEAGMLNFFGALPQHFNADRLQDLSCKGPTSRLPVFILGMPRSGTSLVEQIIASHSQVVGAGELRALRQILRGHFGPSADDARFVERLANLDGKDQFSIGQAYLSYIRELAPGALRITDKLPGNVALAGLIHLILPQARIIHCRRKPMDTCLSCYSRLFTTGHEFTYDLVELGRFYCAYHSLAEHWRHVLPPECFLEVNYEELVADTEIHARRIIAHCGLDWDPACLRFYATKRPVKTASLTQVRQPIYITSIERSRRYARELAPLRWVIEAIGLRENEISN